MKKYFTQLKNRLAQKKGFAMLFTVLVISIILSIGLGIANTTFKQTILSNLAKDSQQAFYQADSGVECGLYYDLTAGQLPRGTTISEAQQTLGCGDNTMTFQPTQSHTDYFVYNEDQPSGNQPCYSVTFDKTDPLKNVVSARGFSTCVTTAQQVERGLMVRY
jgi:Tfp pilus assembly protein PilX